MTDKPKPLDGVFKTKRLRKKVKREFRESFENGYTKFDDIVDTAVYLIKEKMREIKQRIKQACEFYLRYKSNWTLFAKEQPKLAEKFMLSEYDITEFNEWLFKLAFKDVLGGEE